VTALINYLYNHFSKHANSGDFRMATYNMAAITISKDHKDGPKKTGTMCKNKWLKKTYNAIETYQNQSGVHWDNNHGTNIMGDAAKIVWDAYISENGNKTLKPFYNRGWENYEKIQKILPHSGAQGGN
ncbi:hypothetical protein PAXRUDRAFT_124504, partial [Paxillus rubicundulus Ve08.2h10]